MPSGMPEKTKKKTISRSFSTTLNYDELISQWLHRGQLISQRRVTAPRLLWKLFVTSAEIGENFIGLKMTEMKIRPAFLPSFVRISNPWFTI